ncbi:MAG: malonyl-CoA synthase [Pseudomonadota bacterium]
MTDGLYSQLFAPHQCSEGTFLDCGSRGLVTYRAFLELASRQAKVLRDHGVASGDRVALQAQKSVEALAVYAACAQIGAVLLPLNTAYTPDEVAYFLKDAEPRLLVCDPDAERALTPTAQTVGAATLTLDADGRGTFADAAQAARPCADIVPRAEDDLAAILYTSGTTGRSKGAMMTNRNLVSNARTLTDLWAFTGDDTLIHALPIFHTHGLFVAVNVALCAGARLRFMQKFDLDAILGALPQSTAMMGVPTFYSRLLDDPRLDRSRTADMRLFISGSAPLLAETHASFAKRTGHQILERYGMTETNMITSNPYKGTRVAGTVGMPLPGVEVRITDPATGAPLETGERGAIEVRGPNVFKGYWKMPEKTREEFREDGFFVTGDLGAFDETGYLSIVGRAKDLVISGGYNIYPKEIELVLDTMPDVLESAVIGVPHPDLGEGVVAVLARQADHNPDVDEIRARAAGALAGFKRPRRYVLVDALPRNTMGKVQKAALREMFADAFADVHAGPDAD